MGWGWGRFAPSADPDGDEVTFEWTLKAAPGSSAAALSARDVWNLTDAATARGLPQQRFYPDLIGTYELAVSVADG